MSDCGGFYNLKHSDSGTVTEKVIVKEVPHCAAVEKMDVKYVKERKAAKKHHAITMFFIIAVLLAVVCSALLVLRMNVQMNELKEQIDNIQIEIPTYPTEAPLDKPNDEQETEPPIESMPYRFTIDTKVINGDTKEISNTSDFGDYAKSVKVTTAATENEKGCEFSVSFFLDEDALVGLNLMYGQEETEDRTVGVKCNSSIPLFENEDFTYSWQYRTGSEDWMPCDQTLIAESDGYYSLSLDENLWDTAGEEEASRDLRCVIQVEDAKENMMTITVEVFTFSLDNALG